MNNLTKIHQLEKEIERLTEENMQYAIDNKELKCTNIKLNNEINMLKITIARNESYIKRLTHTGVWENKCR